MTLLRSASAQCVSPCRLSCLPQTPPALVACPNFLRCPKPRCLLSSKETPVVSSAGRQERNSTKGPGPSSAAQCPESSTSEPSLALSSSVEPPAAVYVATLPLDVPRGPPEWALAVGSLLYAPLGEHCMTIICTADGECRLFDFRPMDPSNPAVAVRVLRGQAVPGDGSSPSILSPPCLTTQKPAGSAPLALWTSALEPPPLEFAPGLLPARAACIGAPRTAATCQKRAALRRVAPSGGDEP